MKIRAIENLTLGHLWYPFGTSTDRPPGSESNCERCGSRSGSRSFPFSYRCWADWKIACKILVKIKFLRLKMMCRRVSYKEKNMKKIKFFGILKSLKKGVGSGSISQKYGSANPDPHQNVTDLQTGVPCLGSCGGGGQPLPECGQHEGDGTVCRGPCTTRREQVQLQYPYPIIA